MKLQLSTSALLVWLAAYIHAAEIIENSSEIHKRGLVIDDQPVIGEATVARTIGDSTSADDSSAIAAAVAAAVNPELASNQIIQSPAVMLDNTLSNLRGSSLGYLQLQQALNSPHFMLNPGVGIPPGMQRFANLPQIVLQAPPAAPVAPVTIVQTVSVTATAPVSTLTSQTAAAPVTTTVFSAATVAITQYAVHDIVTVTAPAPVVVTVFESVATPVAAVAPAAVPAPIAVAAPVAAPAATGAAAFFAQLPYPDVTLNQAVAAAAVVATTAPSAVVADPVAAMVLAQQQLYPAAIGAQQQVAQPLLAQVPTAALAFAPAVAGAIPTASILGSNQNAQPVLLPIDSQLAELLSRSGLASALLSDSGAAPLGAVDDNTADSSQDVSAAIDEDDVYVAPPQSPKTLARHMAPRTNNRKSKLTVDADAELDSASADVAEEDAPPAKPAANVSAPRKNKVIAKTAGTGTAKKAAALKSTLAAAASAAKADTDESAAADLNISDVPNMRFRASSGSTEETLNFEAEVNSVPAVAVDAENEYELSCARTLGTRGRGTVTNLKDEASKVRAEASAEAREAVLSEIRAEASAQAALQASSELRLSGKTVVHDEAAYSERTTNSYNVDREYRKKTQTSYDEETQRSWAPETEANYILGIERYQITRSKSADFDTWNYHHQSDSWENKPSLNYDDTQSPPYHPYATSSYDQSQANYGDYNERPQIKYADSYGHMQSNYGDELATNGNWKLHYDGASPTMYPASDASSYINYNSDPCPYTNPYYTNSYSNHQGESHAGYNGYDAQIRPFNFVNMRFDAALARDAAGVSVNAPWSTISAASLASASNIPLAVNELDPLSYATEPCSFRKDMPLMISETPMSACPSVMIIGVPQPTMPVSVPVNMPAPQAATVTKLVTQAVKFVLASNSNNKDDEDSD
ncbi:hypothetical protein GGF37_002062 [Kickxella alabastrina]|nr:hypothetical protein GGF37_002062 [Kickxella alabastrina]